MKPQTTKEQIEQLTRDNLVAINGVPMSAILADLRATHEAGGGK